MANVNEMQVNAVNQNQGAKHAEAFAANMKASSNQKVAPRVFRSNVPSIRFVFKNGKVASFLSGKYATNIAHEIIELDEEIANNHPNITANVEEVLETIEPLEILKKRHIEEYLAAQAVAVNKSNDAGNSIQTKLNVLNSNHVAEAMAGSDSSGNSTTNPNPVKISINAGINGK